MAQARHRSSTGPTRSTAPSSPETFSHSLQARSRPRPSRTRFRANGHSSTRAQVLCPVPRPLPAATGPGRRRRQDWVGYTYLLPALGDLHSGHPGAGELRGLDLPVRLERRLRRQVGRAAQLRPSLPRPGRAPGADPLDRPGLLLLAHPVAIGLVLTGIIARHPLRGTGIWRTILFLPQVLSVVVVGVSWRWILNQDGPFNALLRAVGLGRWTKVWLGDFTWALPTEGAIGTWMLSGLCMVLFLAGAQSIDTGSLRRRERRRRRRGPRILHRHRAGPAQRRSWWRWCSPSRCH